VSVCLSFYMFDYTVSLVSIPCIFHCVQFPIVGIKCIYCYVLYQVSHVFFV